MSTPQRTDLWVRLDELIDRAPGIGDLRAHRLHLLAIDRWRRLGRQLPERLLEEERWAGILGLTGTVVLARVCAAVSQPVLLFKGFEVATHYPDPRTRPVGDIDLLVADAPGAQQALIEAGFQPVVGEANRYDELHHLEPLVLPEFPILIEVHRRPAWPEWLPEPPIRELLTTAVPSQCGVEGLMAPSPAYHALLVAGHAWDLNPLGRIIDLVDVQLLAAEAGRDAVSALADAVGVTALWKTTLAASDALFTTSSDDRLPWAARNLAACRDSTVFGQHIRRWASPFWVLPPLRATHASATTIVRDVLPAAGETWRSKVRRTRTAARNGFRRKWSHDTELGDAALRPPRRRRY